MDNDIIYFIAADYLVRLSLVIVVGIGLIFYYAFLGSSRGGGK